MARRDAPMQRDEARNSWDSLHATRQRKGGAYGLSLDAASDDDGYAPIEPVAPDLFTIETNWPAALRQAGFTPDEILAFPYIYLDDRCKAATAIRLLKWLPARFARAKLSLSKKLPARLVQLRGIMERQVSDSIPTIRLCAQLMAAERLQPIMPETTPLSRTSFMEKTKTYTLDAQLASALGRLRELEELRDQNQAEVTQLRVTLIKAEIAAKTERATALKEKRPVKQKVLDALEPIASVLAAEELNLQTAVAAIVIQYAEIEPIQNELDGQRRGRLLAEVHPKAARALSLIAELGELSAEINANILRSRTVLFAVDLWPELDESQTTRDLRLAVLNQAGQYRNYQHVFYNKGGRSAAV